MCVTVGTYNAPVIPSDGTNQTQNHNIDVEIEKNIRNELTNEEDMKNEIKPELKSSEKINKSNNNIYSIIILGVSYLMYKIYNYN
jgi:hypothetical protein